jgi:glutaredoxin
MTLQLQIYTRKSCCLCEEMKNVVREAASRFPMALQETDVDDCADLQALYGAEVPVLFINGRKAFKYRVTTRALEKRLRREAGPGVWSKLKRAAVKKIAPER